MHFDAFDRYHEAESFLHRLDPRVKVVVTVVFILSNALLPDGAWSAFGLSWLFLLLANLLSRLGIGFTLAGVAACAVYTVITRRWMEENSTLAVITAQQVCALIFALSLLGVPLLRGESFAVSSWSVGAWASAVVSGVLYYALAFWLYLTGLRRIPAALAGLFLNLIPIFGVGSGYLLGERLSALQMLGAALIVGAVGSMLWVRARSIPLTGRVPSIIVDDR